MFLKLLELVGIAVFIILFVTQVMIPLAQSKNMFPLFRQRKLTGELSNVKSKADDIDLGNAIADQKARNEHAAAAKSDGQVQK